MTKGPHRLVLDSYLDSASGGVLAGAGRDWKRKAQELQTLSEALRLAAQQAELRIGEQTLTGPAVRAGMEESSTSMALKAEQLTAAGQALVVVGQQVSDTREARDAMADLGEKPAPYQAPPGSPGLEPTPEELQAQAEASQARQNERNAWQSQYDKQEARSLALTKQLDAAFLGAIPPMQEIHGQQDPTEPPPDVPSGPGGTYLPGTQAPIPTGGGAGGSGGKDAKSGVGLLWEPADGGKDGVKDPGKDRGPSTTIGCNLDPQPTTPTTTHVTHPTHVTETPTTTVSGHTQSGVTYQPTGSLGSAPAASTGTSGSTAAALGAAGAAGGAGGLAGAMRPGSVPSSSAAGAAAARPIGSTARSGSAGALSRSAGSPATARSGATTGSPTSRSAGSAGSSAGRGAAGGRGASGSTSGSRSGGRGSSGARGTGSAGGRGGRKGERDRTTDRDALVYEQDWLGDDDVAPGVLD